MADGGGNRRASCLGCSDLCTIVLLDGNKRPMMNLHKVPSSATVLQIKKKVSERLKEVGRSLSAEAMILYAGENRDEANEMRNEEFLSAYNTLGVSRFTVTIIRRTRLDLNIVLVRPEQKCLCITKQKSQREEFPVTVPMAYSVAQFLQYVAQTMNCGVSRKDLLVFWDENLQERFPSEGTLRQLGMEDKASVYFAMPANFDINNIQYPVLDGTGGEKKVGEGEAPGGAAAGGPAEPLIEEETAAVDESSALKKDFEKRAKKGIMAKDDVGNFARSLGYSPSVKEIASLQDKGVDFKNFQEFLAVAMHPDDTQESFKSFFSAFDVQATGDLSRQQVLNILQLWGDEPLSPGEAKAFCDLALGKEDKIAIAVLLDFIQEGAA